MSLSFSLVCDETRQRLWVGQGHHDPTQNYAPVMDVLYFDPVAACKLMRFLNATRDKPLRLVVNDYPETVPTLEYEEFK